MSCKTGILCYTINSQDTAQSDVLPRGAPRTKRRGVCRGLKSCATCLSQHKLQDIRKQDTSHVAGWQNLRTLLWPRLLLRWVRPLNLKPDTVLPSLLPTADTDSGKSASSESSAARAASWSWSDSCRQSRGARGRSARTRRAAAQCCCRRASAG